MLQRFVLALTLTVVLVIGLGAPAAPQTEKPRSGLGLDGQQGQFLIDRFDNLGPRPAFIRGVYDTGIGPYDTADA